MLFQTNSVLNIRICIIILYIYVIFILLLWLNILKASIYSSISGNTFNWKILVSSLTIKKQTDKLLYNGLSITKFTVQFRLGGV